MSTIATVRTPTNFEKMYYQLCESMLRAPLFDRGEVHAQKTTTPEMVTRELRHITQYFSVPATPDQWMKVVSPNLTWAEDHFQERVSGRPLNPPPSNEWWPFNRNKNAEHKKDDKFSHTYPERFWPKMANAGGTIAAGSSTDGRRRVAVPHVGLRFEYGDLGNLVHILSKNPRSRQAYLPVWFPEDLAAADAGERVPCTLGYHFLLNPNGMMDMTYTMRSCDMIRFYRDDIYMAGRLLQWVVNELNTKVWLDSAPQPLSLVPGELVLHIANLHTFDGDRQFMLDFQDNWEDKNDMTWGAGV